MREVTAAYYVVHSMGGDAEFAQREIQAERNFAEAGAQAGIQRVI